MEPKAEVKFGLKHSFTVNHKTYDEKDIDEDVMIPIAKQQPILLKRPEGGVII
jgi:hypothetical protein